MTTIPATSTTAVRRADRPVPSPIPFGRLVSVELRKCFDTRAGFWLMASIGLAGLLATGAVLLWAPDAEITYSTFATAIGFPMAIILPMIAVLSVTSEWSQRSGLTSFTLVPHRGRVIASKAAVTLGISIVSVLLAMAIGVLGTIGGSAILGVDPVWDVTTIDLLNISLAQTQDWFADLRPWVDFNFAQGALFNGSLDATQWANLGVTSIIWLVVPMALGLWTLMRSEVK
jgi:ABC-2 type transport system permease protein